MYQFYPAIPAGELKEQQSRVYDSKISRGRKTHAQDRAATDLAVPPANDSALSSFMYFCNTFYDDTLWEKHTQSGEWTAPEIILSA